VGVYFGQSVRQQMTYYRSTSILPYVAKLSEKVMTKEKL